MPILEFQLEPYPARWELASLKNRLDFLLVYS